MINELIIDSVKTTLNSFDFSFCVVVNLLTYFIIKIIDELNGRKKPSTWTKRLILFIVIIITASIYYIAGLELKLLINSSILAPVFWSWIIKPLFKIFNIDYKQINK